VYIKIISEENNLATCVQVYLYNEVSKGQRPFQSNLFYSYLFKLKDTYLMIHDCLSFGLNNSPKEEQNLSKSYFFKALNLFQPEAMSFWTKMAFYQLKNRHDLKLNKDALNDKDFEINENEILNSFLEWLEKLAYMDRISMGQVEFIRSNGYCPLPEIVLDLIKRNDSDQYVEKTDEIIDKIILCSNEACYGMIEEEFKGCFCKLCLKVLYCSRACKLI